LCVLPAWAISGGLLEVHPIPLTQISQKANYLILGEIGLKKEPPIRRMGIPTSVATKPKILQPFLNRNTTRKSADTADGKTLL
jgi:hypothetical protein